MIVQMIVFGRINDLREKKREGKRMKQTRIIPMRHNVAHEEKHTNGHTKHPNGVGVPLGGTKADGKDGTDQQPYDRDCPSSETDSDSVGTSRTTDSEIIL